MEKKVYSNKEIRDLTKVDMEGNWGAAVLLIILSSVIAGLVSQLISSLVAGFGPSPTIPPMTDDPEVLAQYLMTNFQSGFAAASLAGIVTNFIQAFFDLGIDFGFLDAVDGKKLKIEHLIAAFTKNPGKNLLVIIIKNVIIFIGTLLLIIPGIILSFMLIPVNYLLKDEEDMEIMDILNKSRELMRGHKWNIFVVMLPYMLAPVGLMILVFALFGILLSQEIMGLAVLILLVGMIGFIVLTYWCSIKLRVVVAGYYRRNLMPRTVDPAEGYYYDSNEDVFVEYEEIVVDEDDLIQNDSGFNKDENITTDQDNLQDNLIEDEDPKLDEPDEDPSL